MAENMTVVTEVWPLAVDEYGLWLVSGDGPWRSAAVAADSDPHFEVELTVGVHNFTLTASEPMTNPLKQTLFVHSTSWRCDGPQLVVTYLVCLDTKDKPVRARWSDALPVDRELLTAVGHPCYHEPTEAPAPREVDVLHHGLQHLCYLLDHNSGARLALTGFWETHLRKFTPALAKMYN